MRTFKIELSPNLKNYYNNDFNCFIDELKNKKVNIKPRDVQELLELEYNNSLSAINQLQKEIHESETKINHGIYELYELTAEEIAIVENSFKE